MVCQSQGSKGEGGRRQVKLLSTALLKVTFFISANPHFRHRDNTSEKLWLGMTIFLRYVLAAGIKAAPFSAEHCYVLHPCRWVSGQSPWPEEPLHYIRELKYPSHSSQIYQGPFPKLFSRPVDAYKSHQEHVALGTTKASVRQSSLQNCFWFFS